MPWNVFAPSFLSEFKVAFHRPEDTQVEALQGSRRNDDGGTPRKAHPIGQGICCSALGLSASSRARLAYVAVVQVTLQLQIVPAMPNLFRPEILLEAFEVKEEAATKCPP